MSDNVTGILPGLSALTRGGKQQTPFLDAHHVAAAERFHKLFARSRIAQKTTMQYGPRTGSGGKHESVSELSDMAADARILLGTIQNELPRDCAVALIDVCGFEKGLQALERECGWPRRSGKIILRIALEHLALRFGLLATAQGPDRGRHRRWLSPHARPTEFR